MKKNGPEMLEENVAGNVFFQNKKGDNVLLDLRLGGQCRSNKNVKVMFQWIHGSLFPSSGVSLGPHDLAR